LERRFIDSHTETQRRFIHNSQTVMELYNEYHGQFGRDTEAGRAGGDAPIFPPNLPGSPYPVQVQMPGMVQMPIPVQMTMPPSAEIDYNCWLAENFHRQQYRTTYCDTQSTPYFEQDYPNAQNNAQGGAQMQGMQGQMGQMGQMQGMRPTELDLSYNTQDKPTHHAHTPHTQDKRFYADLVDSQSAQSSVPTSPRYGPGPPIVTSNR
jgi:hypothetical protein